MIWEVVVSRFHVASHKRCQISILCQARLAENTLFMPICEQMRLWTRVEGYFTFSPSPPMLDHLRLQFPYSIVCIVFLEAQHEHSKRRRETPVPKECYAEEKQKKDDSMSLERTSIESLTHVWATEDLNNWRNKSTQSQPAYLIYTNNDVRVKGGYRHVEMVPSYKTTRILKKTEQPQSFSHYWIKEETNICDLARWKLAVIFEKGFKTTFCIP